MEADKGERCQQVMNSKDSCRLDSRRMDPTGVAESDCRRRRESCGGKGGGLEFGRRGVELSELGGAGQEERDKRGPSQIQQGTFTCRTSVPTPEEYLVPYLP